MTAFKNMRKNKEPLGYRMLATIAMLLFVVAMLLTSFQIAIYGDPDYKFYQKEYEKYYVTHSLNMKIEDVMEVTDYMMDYLIGKEDELSIVTEVDDETQDFFNEQDRLHMADVRNLFVGGLKVRTICLVIAGVLSGFLILKKTDWLYLFSHAYLAALIAFLGIMIFLGGAFAVDFTRCFTIFHKIFFTNDLWLFDPATDYMIRMLPEGFFVDMVIRIGSIFLIILLVIWVLFRIFEFISKNNKKVKIY